MFWVGLEALVVRCPAEHGQMTASGRLWKVVDLHYLRVVVVHRLGAVDDPYIVVVTRQCPVHLESPPLHRYGG